MELSIVFLFKHLKSACFLPLCIIEYQPLVIAPALLILLTGGLSLPSLCHGVLAWSSFASPIALSI